MTDVHNADHEVIIHAAIGSTVHDKATVSGSLSTPTGTVDFTVYTGSTTCSGEGAAAGTVTLASGIAHPSNTAVVPVGGLSYKAHYNGNDVYDASDGACEPLAGDKLGSSTVTDIHNAAHGVITSAPIGSTVHDKATVSGGLTTPTGTVDFTVYMGNSSARARGRRRHGHARRGRRPSVEHGGGAGGWPVVQGALQRQRHLQRVGRRL